MNFLGPKSEGIVKKLTWVSGDEMRKIAANRFVNRLSPNRRSWFESHAVQRIKSTIRELAFQWSHSPVKPKHLADDQDLASAFDQQWRLQTPELRCHEPADHQAGHHMLGGALTLSMLR